MTSNSQPRHPVFSTTSSVSASEGSHQDAHQGGIFFMLRDNSAGLDGILRLACSSPQNDGFPHLVIVRLDRTIQDKSPFECACSSPEGISGSSPKMTFCSTGLGLWGSKGFFGIACGEPQNDGYSLCHGFPLRRLLDRFAFSETTGKKSCQGGKNGVFHNSWFSRKTGENKFKK